MANISIGGHSSEGSVIIQNKIFGGRCEGIFLMQTEKIRIYKNKI